MTAYYNEIDAYAAQWLRNLIARGLIAPGDVDTRSIAEVKPDDIRRYTQVHFFAGIGGWSYAARLAGWPDDRRLWTGSCPCQPFSAAGKRKGAEDARHLWPEMRRLVSACRPVVVAGEQVASKDGRVWLAGVRTDLEDLAYDCWAADSCSAGVGSPNIRQRLYWLADADVSAGRQGRALDGGRHTRGDAVARAGSRGGRLLGGLAHADSEIESGQPVDEEMARRCGEPAVRVGDADVTGSQGWGERLVECGYQWPPGAPNLAVHCTDGKARRFEPGSFPLAHGVSGRVGRLRAYGNAINPYVAAEVLASYRDGKADSVRLGAFA